MLSFLVVLAFQACELGQNLNGNTNQTALGISNPTNNQVVYNPVQVVGSYYDVRSLNSLKIYSSPNYGGSTNMVAVIPQGGDLKTFLQSITLSNQGWYYIWAVAVNQDQQLTVSPRILVQSMGAAPNTNNYDFVPPQISFSAPSNNQIVSSSFNVSGEASDNKSGVKNVYIQLDSSAFSPVPGNKENWNTNLSVVSAGLHTIRVYASDLSNNISITNTLQVNHVAGLPVVLIGAPANNTLTNSSTINLSGTSSVSSGSINQVLYRINSGSFNAAGGTTSWTVNNLSLNIEGTNTITVMAIASTGLSNSVSLKVVKDTLSPSVSISTPTNNRLFSSDAVVSSGTASDSGSGIKNVKIGINGNYVNGSYANGSWTSTFNYADGSYTLSVYAVDKAGNQSTSATRQIMIDKTAPELSINTIPSTTTNSSLNLSGTASDATSGLKGVYVSLNGAAFTQTTVPTSWTKALTLANGLNTIKVYSLDNAGHATTNTVTITLSSGNGFKVYFKKPAAWPGAYIHYWPAGTTWANKPAMTSEGSGWYSWTFSDFSHTNFLFANASGTNVTSQSPDFHRNISGYYWTNNQWYPSNPEDATYPILVVNAPYDYREVTSTTLYVLGTAAGGGGISGVYVSVNNGSFNSANGAGSWTYNTSLILGTNTVKIYALGNSGYSSSTNIVHIIRKNGGGNTHPGTYSGKLGAHVYSDGVEFSVWWRPSLVDQVYVKGDFNGWSDTATPMTRITSGTDQDIWWVFVPGANAGDEYRLVGKKGSTYTTVIDPASRYNRYDGGNSVVVNQDAFTWTDSGWSRPAWKDYIIYELHVKDFSEANAGHNPPFSTTHSGKYLGVKDGLTYLTNLGITAIELMPPSEFGDAGYSWGYNTALFFAVESGYATVPNSGQLGVDEMKDLINTCHQYGVAVIFDMVFNHTGGSNPFWAIDKVAYFDWDGDGVVEANGPPTDSGDDKTPWGNHFNTKHPAVVRYGKEVLEYFMNDFHVDGFRFDASHTDFIAHSFLQSMKSHCMSIDPNVFFVYENLPNQNDLKTWGGQWNDGYHDTAVSVYRGAGNATWMKWHIDGIPDWAGSYVEKVNYVESHDEDTLGYHAFRQPPNGVNFSVGTAKARSRLMAVMLYTSLGIPMQFMGQESLTDKEGQNTLDSAFMWGSYTDLTPYYAGVINLRKNHPALKSGNISTMYDPNGGDPDVFAYQRWASGDNTFVIVLNFNQYSSKTVTIAFPSDGTWTKVITEGSVNQTGTINVSGGSASITIGANSGIIFMK